MSAEAVAVPVADGAPRQLLKPAAVQIALIVLLLFTLVPLALIWFTAFKSSTAIATAPYAPPKSLYLENFKSAWTVGHFSKYFLNSILIAVPTVVGSVAISILGGYAFARLHFFGARAVLAMLTLGLMIPIQSLILPLFLQMRTIHLLGSPWSVTIAQIGFGSAFGIFMMRSFFKTLPRELEDAGRVDGCSDLRVLLYVVLPLAWPAVLSLTVFQLLFSWNNFLLPLVFLTDESQRTLPLGLMYFQSKYGITNWGQTAAGVVVLSAPIVLCYLALQRHFVRGLVAGGVKG